MRPADIGAYLSVAASVCEDRGEKFTSLRRNILRVLLEAEEPLRAYEMIPRLEAMIGRKISAMTIYRILEFFTEQGIVAALARRNVFAPRTRPDNPHISIFHVCGRCGASIEVETPDLDQLISRDAARLGFVIGSQALEVQGVCSACLERYSPRRSGANFEG